MLKTKIMGIINVTPDSFFQESCSFTIDSALKKAIEFERQGVDIIDIGGESTRPFAAPVSEEEEINRVIPVIQELKKNISIPISIDTTKYNVAKKAYQAGASMINDISGFTDIKMRDLALESKVDICVMHMQGTPKTMQINPFYENGIITHLMQWFEEKIRLLTQFGIDKEKIILDPGMGFGKSIADNLEIIHNLGLFKNLGCRILLGASRKSFISKILNAETKDLLLPTLAIATLAIDAGTDILRVHDVKEHRVIADFMETYKGLNNKKA